MHIKHLLIVLWAVLPATVLPFFFLNLIGNWQLQKKKKINCKAAATVWVTFCYAQSSKQYISSSSQKYLKNQKCCRNMLSLSMPVFTEEVCNFISVQYSCMNHHYIDIIQFFFIYKENGNVLPSTLWLYCQMFLNL